MTRRKKLQYATGIYITELLYPTGYQVGILAKIYIIIIIITIIKITLLLYFSIKAYLG